MKGVQHMNEILKEIESAYKIVSSIPVSGDAVDAVAVVRGKLRNAYAELEKIEKASKDGASAGCD